MASKQREYLTITLPLPIMTKADKKTAAAFQHSFPPQDVFLQIKEQHLTIKLKQLNFTQLEEFTLTHPTALAKAVFTAIAGIKSYNIKGAKRLYANYRAERKVKHRRAKEAKRDKIYYTRGHNFSPLNHPPPAQFLDQILCGDSLELLQALPDNCVDLIFTSPPYNFGLDYHGQQDDHCW